MGKYELVASHYDFYRHEYLNEIVIKYPNIDLTKLENIDHFTSGVNEFEMIQKISEHNQLTNQNHFSIRYFKTKNSDANYFSVIYENPVIHTMSSQISNCFIGNGKHVYANAVPRNMEFYSEFKEIAEMLKSKNIQYLVDFFGPHHSLTFLAQQYINCDPYEYEGINQLEQKLMQEFSRYKTFRGWIISKQKGIHKKKSQQLNQNPVKKTKQIIPKSIEENEQQFENNFRVQHNITYQQHQLNQYNLKYLEDDKEEFIGEDEMDQMGYTK